jgi:hypothetical protein
VSANDLSIRTLRRRWKPHKERLSRLNGEHPTNVRFHRACSWVQRAEQITEGNDLDLALIARWVAFNALYGQWDGERHQAVGEIESWKHLLQRLHALDAAGHLVDLLQTHKPLALSIFEDEYLSKYFWKAPGPSAAKRSRSKKLDAQSWYVQQSWLLILDQLVDRIYLLRCQLVHGAATFNSSFNRVAIRRCSMMLDHLIRVFLLIWIEFGADEDWGIMCYPPLKTLPWASS